MRRAWLLCMLLAGCRAAGAPAAGPAPALRPDHLRCEHRSGPLGIDEPAPHLDWRDEPVDPDARGVAQSGWQVVAASDARLLADDRPDLWDSGRVASDATSEIEYAGRPLRSNEAVCWKVRVWDQAGAPSPWSEVAQFSTGLLAPSDWQARWIGWDAPLASPPGPPSAFAGAQWIWFAADPDDAPACERWLRGRWTLPDTLVVRTASLAIAVDNHHDVFLNGEKVGESHDDPDAWRHGQQFDVAARLHRGENVIAVDARNATPGRAGVLVRLTVNAGAEDERSWTSDASWRASDQPAEHWQEPAFDDSGWPAARSFGAHGIDPWGTVGARPLVLPPPRCLRKDFRVEGGVARATLFVAALGLYRAEIDGQPVGDDFFTPGWTDYRQRVYYQAYDVTGLVRRGDNALGVVLADGWYAGYVGYAGQRNHYGDSPRALVQLVIEHDDGTASVVASDGTWRASTGALREADFLMGETCDARQAQPGWSAPGFDATGWAPVDVTAKVDAVLQAHPGERVHRIQEFTPRTITQVAPDSYVLDLGQNIAGVARLVLRGTAGQRIVLRYAERLNPDGTLYTANLRSARATDTYVCRGVGTETFEPRFTFHGFQYIEISGLRRRPDPGTVTGVALSSDTPPAGSLQCSDPMVNRLFQNTLWTQRANFIDVPTDCPQRDERLGWTGDAQVYIRTANDVADAQAFYTKWLVDLQDAQRADGQFPMVAPLKVAGDDGGPAWSDAGVICPWTIYDVYADSRELSRHFDSMKRYVDFCERRCVDLLPPAKFHCFGDWVAIGADTPREVIFEAYFAGSARLVALAADALGRSADSARYWKLYRDVKAAFNRAYVGADGVVQGDTQCCYVLAIAFDLVDGEQRARVAQHLVDRIAERGWHLSTGFVGTKDLMLALAKIGRNDVAYRLLLNTTFPSWGFTIANGATSIWERWDGWTPDRGFQDPGMNSFAHYAFGAVTQWMFENIGGIRPAAPGYASIELRPQPGGDLTWARVGYDSVRGRIESDWTLDGGSLALDVTVPPNTRALLAVPTADAASVREGGRAIDAAHATPGVRFVRAGPDEVTLELQSGRYHLVCGAPVVRTLDAP